MNDKFPIIINGQEAYFSSDQVGELIKKHLRSSSAIMRLFDEFEVAPERLDDLQFVITPLDHKYAETDARMMKLNSFLFEHGDFFEKYFYIVPHELIHWLSRVREEDAYFNDPEEVLGFVASIAYEMEHSPDLDIIWNKVYPKISWHFQNEGDAREFFGKMIEKARKLLKE